MTDPRTPRTGRLAFDDCPTCSDPSLVRLPADWQAQVGASALIPIVGCGNPWHYVGIEASTLGSSERLAAEKAVIRERGRLYSEVGRLSTFVVPTGVYVDVSDVLSLLDEPLSDPDAERQRAIGEAERARLRREYDERMEMIGAASPPADVSAWDILRWVRDELLVDDPSTALPAAQEPERKF
jgi:hypothetical protein